MTSSGCAPSQCWHSRLFSITSFQLPSSGRSIWWATLALLRLVRRQVGLDEARPPRRSRPAGSRSRQMKIRPATLRTWMGLSPKRDRSKVGRLGLGEDQAAVGPVGPLVVGADDVADLAARLLEQPRAAVPADVVEGADLLVVVAQDDHRVRADVDGDVVAGFGDLRLGGAEQPVPARRSPPRPGRTPPGWCRRAPPGCSPLRGS